MSTSSKANEYKCYRGQLAERFQSECDYSEMHFYITARSRNLYTLCKRHEWELKESVKVLEISEDEAMVFLIQNG